MSESGDNSVSCSNGWGNPSRRDVLSVAAAVGAGMAVGPVGCAVYHATGKRLRELPITLDQLL